MNALSLISERRIFDYTQILYKNKINIIIEKHI